MQRRRQGLAWPYLIILSCLFALSVSAPRAWQNIARPGSMQAVIARCERESQYSTDEPRETPAAPAEPVLSAAEGNDAATKSAASAPVYLVSNKTTPPADATAGADNQSGQPHEDDSIPASDPWQPEEDVAQAPATEAADHAVDAAQAEVDAAEADSAGVELGDAAGDSATEEDTAGEEDTSDEDAAEDEPTATPESAPAAPAAEETHAVTAPLTWATPKLLLAQLHELQARPRCAAWATSVERQLMALTATSPADHDARAKTLAGLQRSAAEGEKLLRVVGRGDAPAVARARFALERRLAAWQVASELLRGGPAALAPASTNARLSSALAEVQRLMSTHEGGAAWSNYLLIDQLHRAAARATGPLDQKLLERALGRMSKTGMSPQQLAVVQSPAVRRLQSELEILAAGSADPLRFVQNLEDFESDQSVSRAVRVGHDWRAMQSAMPAAAKTGTGRASGPDPFDAHYRNANLRIVVAGKLLNRMLPQPDAVTASVNDTIVGVPVVGQSTTFTELSVRLIPDPQNVRLGLEASGVVASDTSTTSGPATFYTNGNSSFLVRKLVVVDRGGLRVWPAIAEADTGYADSVSLETDFDGVPLIGKLVRNMARSQREEVIGSARYEVKEKVAARARMQLDERVEPRLEAAVQKAYERTLAPLAHLGLETEPVHLSTTEDRITMRLRLAGYDQPGAHTARPRAPSDSLLSLQIHHSVLNNAAECMALNGRTFTLPELFAHLGERLTRPDLTKKADLPDDVRVTFAAKDAVRVSFEKDRVAVALSFAELTQHKNRWRNFTVRTYYRPQAVGVEPRLVRDSSVYLEGKSLRGKPQVLLRSIFSKVLSRERTWSVINPQLLVRLKTENLNMSQYAVEDGWIAVAYTAAPAPANVARRPQ